MGLLTRNEFVTELERANRTRFEDEAWEFNTSQREAILHGEGPLHLTAGPGSGKTEVLVSRALKLILVDDVAPASIILTTFTEKAAQSLEERIVDRLQQLGYADEVDANEIRIGTLHSLCNDIMHEYRYEEYTNVELLDEDGQQLFMYDNCAFVSYLRGSADASDWRTAESQLTGDEWEAFEDIFSWRVSSRYGPNKWQATEAAAKLFNRVSQYRTPTDNLLTHPDPSWRALGEGLERYRQTLAEHNRCDFARLLERFIEFLDTPSGRRFVGADHDRDDPAIRHVLVDEYQDTNPLQQELYFRLLEVMDEPNVTVVGDDDQALYRFRGGTVECLIQFPTRVEDRFAVSVQSIQLDTNYRSTVDIVDWCNQYLDEHPDMQSQGARAAGKEPMEADRASTRGRTSVRGLFKGGSNAEAADRAAELVETLHDSGYVQDYSQIAFLFKSTKETSRWAGPYADALRERGIPVHNPRNKSFLNHEEIEFALGAVIRCLDPDLDGVEAANVMGGVKDQVQDWADQYEDYVDDHDARALERYVNHWRTELSAADSGEGLGLTLLDVLYRILSFEPFRTWIENPDDPARGNRLGRLTGLVDSFGSVRGHTHLDRSSRNALSVSTRFLGSFYYLFCGYLSSTDFDDPEDPHEQLPEGFVQVMTVHQAKGLEFPVVFVSDLDSDPWRSGTYWLEEELRNYADIDPAGDPDIRATRDEIRRFYVAYSRAEEDLILLDESDAPSQPALGYADGEPIDGTWFDGDRRIAVPADFDPAGETVGAVRGVDLKRRYSITGDVLAYRRCKRQYGYYNEMDFAPNHVTQLFFGRVVHETLDRAHRHYAGELDDATEGEIPDDDDIEGYFRGVAEALKSRNIRPMSAEAEETALEYIQRFNRLEGPELYPRVVDTEHKLQSNREDFVLEGVVDVLVGDGNTREIWDYKAGTRPDGGHELTDYTAQLHTYAELYRYREGSYPERGVIYFLGEDDRQEARYELTFDGDEVEDALDAFETTVRDIERSRENRDWFEIAEADRPSDGTCSECDIRWECPARPEYSFD